MSQALQSAQQSLQQAGQQSAENGGKGSKQGQQESSESEMGQEFGSQSGSKSGQQSSSSQSSSSSSSQSGKSNSQNGNRSNSRGKGGGLGNAGQGQGGSVGPQQPLPGAKKDQLVKGTLDPRGKKLSRSYMGTPDPTHDRAAYYQVVPDRARAAEASLNSEEIPVGQKEQVKRYFQSIQGEGAAKN